MDQAQINTQVAALKANGLCHFEILCMLTRAGVEPEARKVALDLAFPPLVKSVEQQTWELAQRAALRQLINRALEV